MIFKNRFNNQIANINDKYLIAEYTNNPDWELTTEEEWKKRFPEETIKYTPTYDEIVDSKIRQRYSISQELAILRQQNKKPQEYQDYYNYCEQCKREAKIELGMI